MMPAGRAQHQQQSATPTTTMSSRRAHTVNTASTRFLPMFALALVLVACSSPTSYAFQFVPQLRNGPFTTVYRTATTCGLGVRSREATVKQSRRRSLRVRAPIRLRGSHGSGSLEMSSSLETNLGEIFKVPDERILKAVEKAGNRAVPSDVATLAGINLNVAKQGLVNLATLVGGDLEVSKDGDVVYNFPSNFRGTLLQKSAYRRAVEAVRGAWPLIFYAIRVSFGITLFASIALIFSTIIVASTAASGEGENRDRGRSRNYDRGGYGGGGFGMAFGPSPFDFFYYRPYYGYYNTPVQARRDPEKMGIFESVFSYIFGDGDPNSDMGQRRVEAAAKLIRANGGAVTAEQLAPLLSPGSPRPDDSGIVDESFVLPVLTALDGSPEVTDDGDIVYVFPSLQTSAIGVGGKMGTEAVDYEALARRNGLKSLSTSDLRQSLAAVGIRTNSMFERSDLVEAAMQGGIEKLPDGRVILREPSPFSGRSRSSTRRQLDLAEPLQEAKREFSVAEGFMKYAAGALGVLNLGGAFYLQSILSDPEFAGILLPGIFGFVQGAMPFLLTYALAFNAIPLVRWLVNKRENAAIEERNQIRTQWASRLKSGGAAVERKLKAAKAKAKSLNVIEAKDVEYTTAKTLSEQGVDDNLLEDFDKRLKNKDS